MPVNALADKTSIGKYHVIFRLFITWIQLQEIPFISLYREQAPSWPDGVIITDYLVQQRSGYFSNVSCSQTVTKARNLQGSLVYEPSQWDMALHCNTVAHSLGACTEWSLLSFHGIASYVGITHICYCLVLKVKYSIFYIYLILNINPINDGKIIYMCVPSVYIIYMF